MATSTTPSDKSRSVHAQASGSDASAPKPKVAVLGTGLLGSAMARRLVLQGFDVIAWNRTQEKADALKQDGCRVEKTAAHAIEAADVVVLMLADAAAIREAVFHGGATASKLKGKTVLQMGTIGPDESRDFAESVAQVRGSYIEAPVLGSAAKAERGALVLMAGCESEEALSTSPALPVLRALGGDAQPVHVGKVGAGAATKLALNQLLGSLSAAFATSLSLMQHNDADVDKFMDILGPSILHAPLFDEKVQRMRDRDYSSPAFTTSMLLKDMKLVQGEGQKHGMNPALLDGVVKVFADAEESGGRGLGDSDCAAVFDAVDAREQ